MREFEKPVSIQSSLTEKKIYITMTSCIQIQMFNAKALVFEFPVFEEMNTVCSQILFMFFGE